MITYEKGKAFFSTLKGGVVLTLLLWGGYFFYLWPQMFFRSDNGLEVGHKFMWGDWAVHMAYTNVFLFRSIPDWFTQNPIFYGESFNYPFFTSMLSGFLMRAGLDYVVALVFPSIVFTFLFLWVLFIFYRSFFRSNLWAFVAVSLFLTSGGLGFVFYLSDLLKDPSLAAILYPPNGYTRLTGTFMHWSNPVMASLFPQRAFLVGLPAVLGALVLLKRWMEKGLERVPYWKLILLGLACSLVAFIHAHSLMALAMICAVLSLFDIKNIRQWAVFGVSAGVPSVLFYFLYYHKAGGASFFGWHPGWMSHGPKDQEINVFSFWFLNWGLFLPLAIWGLWKGKLYKNAFAVSGFVIFVLCNLFKFQPWIWDNSKLFTWSYLLLVIPVVGWSSRFCESAKTSRSKGLKVAFVGALLFFVGFSGALELVRLLRVDRHKVMMFNNEQILLANKFQEISDPLDVVLTSDDHHNWVSSLSGRQILMGYRGWLWSYGIDYRKRHGDILKMFAGGEATKPLLEFYGVKFAVIGNVEKKDYKANETYFLKNYPVVLQNKAYKVFDLSKPVIPHVKSKN